MKRRLLVPIVAALLSACGPAPQPVTPPPANTTVTPIVTAAPSATATSMTNETPPPAEFDPVRVGMTVQGVKDLCDDHIAGAKKLLDQMKALKGAPADKLTYESTIGAFDDIVSELNSAGEFPYLMGVAHPDAAVREAAKSCEPKTDKFLTNLWLDADVAAVLKAYAAKSEKLEGERARLLADTLRDFRRNGFDLPPEKQARLRELNEQITNRGQEFTSNIASSTGFILVKKDQLEGLPPEYIASHAPDDKGDIKITTDYPDYFPFVTYAKDRKAALKLYVEFTNRGGDANVKLLETLIRLRDEKAKLLGYKSWADYAIEPRMAKNPDTVRKFLTRVKDALKTPARSELADFIAMHVKLGGKKTDKLPPPDRYYLEDQVRATKYKLSSQELSEYFEVRAVTKGLLGITAKMYDLTLKEVEAHAWHPDVTAYEVLSKGQKIGKFYLDLYSRPDKYKHAAMFTVRTAKRLHDGTYRTPMAALVCNFPKPGAQPALMQHDEVVTFFHEFGHVLHHLLTRSELATFSGTNTVRDFVEAPSQMFEEWAWSREVLDLFAAHHKTGDKIPDALFNAMQASRSFGRALATQRQLFLAMLDLEYHSRGAPVKTTSVLKEVQNAFDSFPYVEGTHFQSSFGHLVGYDAGYYSYQWALSLSRDVLTRFKKEGLLNAATAQAWRDDVLSKGGGIDERAMIAKFLGREPTEDAYIAYLKGKD
ncbi:MAG: M3 family metallopeptidase [Polyangiaceae bacterium]